MKHLSTLFIGLLALASVGIADEAAPTKAVEAASAADRTGFVSHVYVGLDVQRLTGTSSDAILSLPAGGATLNYYFGEVFGLYTALEYVKRGAANGSVSNSVSFIDAGAGIALRYRGNLFSSTSLNVLHLGAFGAFPLESFATTGAAAIPGSNGITQMYMGFATQASSVYPLGGGVWLGPASWIKFGLGSPVAGTTYHAWFVDVGLGVQVTF